MSLSRAKSFETLYEECEGYDLVLVPDAPLASALNRRLDRPQFGSFAVTPRRLAARRLTQNEHRFAFIELVEATDLDWKEASHAVDAVLECWKHTGAADTILDYDRFATDAVRTALDHVRDLQTTARALSEFRVDADQSVAVVGLEQFTELERSILPADYDRIDPFTDRSFDLPPFRIFESPAAIVDAVLDTVSPENADDVAVVLDGSSRFSPLVESALEAAAIPYYGGPGFADDPDHRAFLRLLRIVYAGDDTRVGDVRPLLTRVGHRVEIEHDEKRLADLDAPGVQWVRDVRETIRDGTFETAVAAYESVTERSLDALRSELDSLGLLTADVTEAAVDDFEFYLQSYDVPVERDDEGVLLADAKSAAYVDRPVVFYLGLDEGWTHTAPRRPWIDRAREFERNIRQFQRLLQNGAEQYYLVQDTAGGTPVTPCLYFEELLDVTFERFGDLDSITHTRTFRRTDDGFERRPLDVDAEPVETVSQSSLNAYVNSPRDYFFGRLVDRPDADYFREGNLFHDFAEFAAAHPSFVTDERLDEMAETMCDSVAPFFRDVDRAVRYTKYRLGLQTIADYLAENPPEGDGLATPDSRGENVFAEEYDRPIDAPHTERWFENDAVGVKGKIDLVADAAHLLDYKSGSKRSARSVVKGSAFDPPSDEPNYQALLYLAHQRTVTPDEPLRFTFFHFLETLDDAVTDDARLEDCLTAVTYYPHSFADHAASEAAFTELQTDAAKACTKTFSQTGYDRYRAAFDAHEFPASADADGLADSAFGQALLADLKAAVGDYKYVEKGCRQAFRHLVRVRERNYFADEVDAFEAFVADRVAELNERRTGTERFPVDGLAGEPNYRYVDHRDCILEGETR